VLGALVAGIGTDLASPAAAIAIVACLTAASGVVVALTHWEKRPFTTALGASSGA
jgi:hypothetical protein